MTEILTESFCERCGTRYTFETAAPRGRGIGALGTLGRGLRNFLVMPDSSFDEALAAARSESDQRLTTAQLEAFHRTFNFCLSCRQYTCADCWNAVEGRCLTCAPMPVAEIATATPVALSAPAIVVEPPPVQAPVVDEGPVVDEVLVVEEPPATTEVTEPTSVVDATGTIAAPVEAPVEPMPEPEPEPEPVAEAQPEAVAEEAAEEAEARIVEEAPVPAADAVAEEPAAEAEAVAEEPVPEAAPEPVVEAESIAAEELVAPPAPEAVEAPEPVAPPAAEPVMAPEPVLSPAPEGVEAPEPVRPAAPSTAALPTPVPSSGGPAPVALPEFLPGRSLDDEIAAYELRLAALESAPPEPLPPVVVAATPPSTAVGDGRPAARPFAVPELPTAASPAMAAPGTCRSCGLSLSASARFCRRCGTAQVA